MPPNRSIRPSSWGGLLLLLTAGGCGYGAVSPSAYQYAQAIYAAANLHADDRLEHLSAHLEGARQSGEISEQEFHWLRRMTEQAERGDWKAAAAAARQLLEDQVNDAKPSP